MLQRVYDDPHSDDPLSPDALLSWIQRWSALRHDAALPLPQRMRNQCTAATLALVAQYPALLRRERGWVHLTISPSTSPPASVDEQMLDEQVEASPRLQHWWCVRLDNSAIVDPSAMQFYRHAIVLYEPYDEAVHGPLPVGKCPNCGSWVFDSQYHGACSVECKKEWLDSLR